MSKQILWMWLCLFGATFADSYFDGYHNPRQLSKTLDNFQDDYGDLIRVQSLAKTVNDLDVWLVTLSANPQQEKPGIAILGGLEGDDPAATELCLSFIEYAATESQNNEHIRNVLNRYVFYIFPCVNPDATARLWQKPSIADSLNARPIDLDSDGHVSEDDVDDLNNDGWITQMRISDPAGSWAADSLFSRLLRKVDPAENEYGQYKVLSEGVDNDGDKNWNEDPRGGVNFNQNFSYEYQPFKTGAGPFPVSEIETRAVADFLFSHDNIALVFSFSHADNLLSPWESSKLGKIERGMPLDGVLPQDAKIYDYVSHQFKKQTAYQKFRKAEPVPGNFAQWAYFHYGRWSFSTPVPWPALLAPSDSVREENGDPLVGQRRLLQLALDHQISDVFVEWSELNHPDFEQNVEIGGFRPGVLKNPPKDSLETIAGSFNSFIVQLADWLPQLQLSTKAEKLENDVCRITASIHNAGYFPTSCHVGEHLQWVRKIKAELQLDSQSKLMSGNPFYLLDVIKGGDAVEKSWLILSESSEAVVRVGSPSVGYVEQTIRLE